MNKIKLLTLVCLIAASSVGIAQNNTSSVGIAQNNTISLPTKQITTRKQLLNFKWNFNDLKPSSPAICLSICGKNTRKWISKDLVLATLAKKKKVVGTDPVTRLCFDHCKCLPSVPRHSRYLKEACRDSGGLKTVKNSPFKWWNPLTWF